MWATVDESGAFELGGVAPGDYRVHFRTRARPRTPEDVAFEPIPLSVPDTGLRDVALRPVRMQETAPVDVRIDVPQRPTK